MEREYEFRVPIVRTIYRRDRPCTDSPDEYLGGAFLLCRDKKEADVIVETWNGKEILPGYKCELCIRTYDDDDSKHVRSPSPSQSKEATTLDQQQDISKEEQQEPLKKKSKTTNEKKQEQEQEQEQQKQDENDKGKTQMNDEKDRKTKKHGKGKAREVLGIGQDPEIFKQVLPIEYDANDPRFAAGGKKDNMKETKIKLKEQYTNEKRPEIHSVGYQLPEQLVKTLTCEMKKLRWPAVSDRNNVDAENYLVLKRGQKYSDFNGYEKLQQALEELLAWADPEYPCNNFALTRNFQSSPHIDRNDQTYQFAISLGDFEGGQLVVECDDYKSINVIDTRNRIAAVDGRYVHWVRGFSPDKERFSIICYSTDEKSYTPKKQSVLSDWKPKGLLLCKDLHSDIVT